MIVYEPNVISKLSGLIISELAEMNNIREGDVEERICSIANNILEILNFDRVAILPNSTILMNKKSMFFYSREGVPNLNILGENERLKQNNGLKGKLEYIIKIKSPLILNKNKMEDKEFGIYGQVLGEGVSYLVIIPLFLMGEHWGVISLARYDKDGQELNNEAISVISSLANMILCHWQLAKLRISLGCGGASDRAVISQLTTKQLQILIEISKGKSARAIGDSLYISQRTVESHTYNIMKLLDLKTKNELTNFSIRNGLV